MSISGVAEEQPVEREQTVEQPLVQSGEAVLAHAQKPEILQAIERACREGG